MHSLRGWKLLVAGGVLGSVRGAVLPAPAITPAPLPTENIIQSLQQRQDPDAISLAQVLLTALPLSLRMIAATNIPAVSSILWEEFLDDKKPQWFLDLPGDVQSYLIIEFGPETAWPTAPPTSEAWDSQATATATDIPTSDLSASNSVPTSASDSPTASGSESLSTVPTSTAASSVFSPSSASSATTTAARSSATTDPDAPPLSNTGLTRQQKIGIGLGVPFGLLGIAALLFGCCFLLRRRKRKHVEGNDPPASPGFIPRFSFQDRSFGSEHHEHRAPLNPAYDTSYNPHGHQNPFDDTNYEDDDYESAAIAASHRASTFAPAAAPMGVAAPMAMHDPQPIMAPLLHTHSSRKARGKRTSYSSLHSVAEVREPDEDMMESPILGRRQSPPKTGPRRPSMPSVLEMPPVPRAATIKRKPVPTSPIASPAAEAASHSLLRPALTSNMAHHSGSSSSGIAISSNSSSSTLGYKNASPVSPISDRAPVNPFSNDYAYLEDYGPEYSRDGYLDHEDGLYGGNRSLDRYPDPSPPRRNSNFPKTEWPLRNVLGSVKRNKSPMWDRVYESP